MKKLTLLTTAGFLFFFGEVAVLFAQPDPRDSIIIESKTVSPGVGSPAALVRVSITNKDSLANVTLVLAERSLSGGAYMSLGWPRNYSGIIHPLTSTLQGNDNVTVTSRYNGVSPDTLIVGMFRDMANMPATVEPPNTVRKPFVELKFDTVWANAGMVEIDSAVVRTGVSVLVNQFVNQSTVPYDIPVNFLKGVITVTEPERGDMDGNGIFSPVDVALLVNCVYFDETYQPRVDVTCDGSTAPSDVVAILRKVFLENGLPQCPS